MSTFVVNNYTELPLFAQNRPSFRSKYSKLRIVTIGRIKKRIFTVLMFMFLMSIVNGQFELTKGLEHYYNMTSVNDSVNYTSMNLHNSPTAITSTPDGGDGAGYHTDTDDCLTFPWDEDWIEKETWMACALVNSSGSGTTLQGFGNDPLIWDIRWDGSEFDWFIRDQNSVHRVSPSSPVSCGGSGFNDGQWHYMCVGLQSNEAYFYVDGSLVCQETTTTNSGAWTNEEEYGLGCLPYNPVRVNFKVASFDEFAFYSRLLNTSEMVEIWNSTDGSGYCNPVNNPTGCVAITADPQITLNTNLSSYTNSTFNPFTFSIDAIGQVINSTDTWNISVYYNNTLNQTHNDISGLNTTAFIINLTYGNLQVGYDINVTVSHAYDNAYDDFQRLNIFLDSVNPVETFTGITNNTVLYYNLDGNITAILQGEDTNLFALNLSLHELNASGAINVTRNNTFKQNINLTIDQVNFTFDINALPNGSYRIDTMLADSHTAGGVRAPQWFTSPDTITIDGDIQIIGDIKENLTEFLISPLGDRYKFKITWNEDDFNHSFTLRTNTNEIIFIPNRGFLGHFVILGLERWIDLEGANINDVTVTQTDTNEFFIEVFHNSFTDEIEFESIGDLNIVRNQYFFNISHGFTFYAQDSISSQALTNFTINILNGSSLIQTGTTTNGNITFNLTTGNYSTNITAAGYVNNETGLIQFTHSGSYTYNLLAANSLYLFFYDEVTDLLVNTTTVTATVLGPSSGNNYSTTTGSIFISGFDVGEYEIRYTAPSYRTRSYFTDIADNTTQTIDLYMIQNTTSSLIIFTIVDEKGVPIDNATLRAQRYFIDDNAYLIVNMERSDGNGEAGMYLVPNDVYYQFVLVREGSTLGTFGPQRLFSSNIVIAANLLENPTASWNVIHQDLTGSLDWNNATNNVTYTWSDASGNVVRACLEITERTALRDTVRNLSCASGASGTILIDPNGYLQNNTYIAKGYIDTNTTFSQWPHLIIYKTIGSNFARFGLSGLFISIFLIGTAFFIGIVINFATAMGLALLVMSLLQILGVVFFGSTYLIAIAIMGFIVAWLNKI